MNVPHRRRKEAESIRFQSARSAGFGALVFGVPALLAGATVLSPPAVFPYALAGTALAAALLLWIWFGTWYEFREGFLLLRLGPFCERIPYGRITEANRVRSMASSMALSSDMIELRHGENYVTGTTFVSPADMAGFLKELAARCPSLRLSAA